MINFIEWIIVIIHLWLFLNVILGKGNKFSYFHIIFYVFEIFFVIPIILNLLLGQMDIKSLGYMFIANDKQVDLIYDIFTLLESIVFYLQIKKHNKRNERLNLDFILEIKNALDKFNVNIIMFLVLIVGTLTPLFAALISPNPSLYFYNFAAFYRREIFTSIESLDFHNSTMRTALYIAFLSISILWLLCKKNRGIIKIYLSAMIVTLTLFSGKRTLGLLLVALVTVIELIYYKKKNQIGTILFSGIIMAGYFIFYQMIVRKTVGGGVSSAYEMYVIYFSRALDMKFVIYSILHSDTIQILDFTGQSYLFNLLFFIPRSIWINKPYPYGVYYTAAWTGQLESNITYRYTVSYFGEAAANFGWVGVIFATLAYLKFVKYVDKFENPIIRIFGFYLIVYLMITHFQSNITNIVVFIIMIMISRMINSSKRLTKNKNS
ncbi:O-antigen polymerase [Clostridium intestinale]|uniref:Oligosaccharide repeat unit polymerase n=1 Tax=Clostridium intestinale URNW TaxID=1294142 RepID=U2Q7U4_9CLOT|nr:O-antigen polymerase [Clostridium intestinale]ERK32244.1 hypothetical protein CINTURNW_0500 [Clostridium intestinale URNW]